METYYFVNDIVLSFLVYWYMHVMLNALKGWKSFSNSRKWYKVAIVIACTIMAIYLGSLVKNFNVFLVSFIVITIFFTNAPKVFKQKTYKVRLYTLGRPTHEIELTFVPQVGMNMYGYIGDEIQRLEITSISYSMSSKTFFCYVESKKLND